MNFAMAAPYPFGWDVRLRMKLSRHRVRAGRIGGVIYVKLMIQFA